MKKPAPTLWWVRRDFRLADNPALAHAIASGGPVVPVFIHDDSVANLGAAPKWRLGLGLEALAASLEDAGSRLILRKGDALDVLRDLIAQTGAKSVTWSHAYVPDAIERDTKVKAALTDDGIAAESCAGHLLFEPWQVETKAGGFYKVYTPFWRAARDIPVAACLPAPTEIAAPQDWPHSDNLADWKLGEAMSRGADVVRAYACVGEAAAEQRLADFLDGPIEDYREGRDFPSRNVTSGLSENLTYGEIAPRRLWHAGRQALEQGAAGAEHFLKEVVWREFAYHLAYHTPRMLTRSWREEWEDFNWRGDNDDAEKWRRGMTGEPMVDAAMRELYTTGTMHNRSRMIAGSYLTKHLLTDWRVGQAWFEQTLIDWDPASNAMGWQWVAGSGPDASPFFRVFNPETQAEKFDGSQNYRDLHLKGGEDEEGRNPAEDFYRAIPKSWNITDKTPRPDRIISLKEGRERALAAYKGAKEQG
ncbi:cryptochrome/photolyase family protein [Neptunicoccus cionae]|uniref:Deoxyribodipyrimidine photo-lyase n=1 Tax=Neptunicoccus cionae TaxID=2035344 RepID=A0A916QSH5_9RHOB|nr:deoxyribodipyrimidine photo-lyase [Amylibacter cionae]GGA09399.1 deoxyribodipyrimidine photo-lyase [Amylibacter cionae]